MNRPTIQQITQYESELRKRGFQIYCGPSDFDAGRCTKSRHPHTARSRHFLGHAIDAGRDPAGGGAMSDFERAHLDLLAGEARNRGYRVIWRRGPGDHQDHVHIEIGDPETSVINLSGVQGITIDRGAFPQSGTEPVTQVKVTAAEEKRGRKLRVGSKGRAVEGLQRGMNKVFPAYSSLPVTGYFGLATQSVVMEFQLRSALKVDGVVGEKTRRALASFGIRC